MDVTIAPLPSETERESFPFTRLDILALKDKLWLAVIESKQTQVSFSMAIPQALADMVSHPKQNDPI